MNCKHEWSDMGDGAVICNNCGENNVGQTPLTRGYKVFNPDWTCRGFKYEVGKTYEENVIPSVCDQGLHFCISAKDCFKYYSFDPNNKVAEVIAHGEIDESDDKCATNKLEIVREIPWLELLTIVNTGKGNNGLWNSGNWNQGDFCTGDFNISDHDTGCFCTEEHKIRIFDVETDMTFSQWRNSDAYYLLRRIEFEPTKWIYQSDMSDEEKQSNPHYEVTGGYLKRCDTCNAYSEWWKSLNKREKNIITSIPNFSALKFEQITGIRVD